MRCSLATLLVVLAMPIVIGATGCLTRPELPPDLSDDPERFVAEPGYRRGVLERDLLSTDNRYARQRLDQYALLGGGWDGLPERDPPSLPLTRAAAAAMVAGAAPPFDDAAATTLEPAALPQSDEEWIELGRRTFFEYPLRADATYEAVARAGALEEVGFLFDGDRAIGLRLFRDADGSVRAAPTCAQCHATFHPDGSGAWAGHANRAMDIGRARLIASSTDPLSEIDSTATEDLAQLGPGRADLLDDGVFNPYSFPDLGGIADMPYLHYTANWVQRGAATLAVRCDTLFITASRERARVPRVLAWAVSRYLRSLPPPPPLSNVTSTEGAALFEARCVECHAQPLLTSDRRVTLAEVGTNDDAGASDERGTGLYRIPSLRGVGRNAPYLHHGAFATLEEMFDPERAEPGHPFGLDLDEDERAQLLVFLRSR